MQYVGVPLWVVELSPPKGRSAIGGMIGWFGVFGYILAAYVGVGFFYYHNTSNAQWRVPLALGCAFPVIHLCIIAWLPESPRWLVAHGKHEQAWTIVSRLHKRSSGNNPSEDFAAVEFAQIQKQCELESTFDSSWKAMATRPSFRKRALLAFFLPAITYTTGNLVVTSMLKSYPSIECCTSIIYIPIIPFFFPI
jgi:MFS family permease